MPRIKKETELVKDKKPVKVINRLYNLQGEADQISQSVKKIGSIEGKTPIKIKDGTYIFTNNPDIEKVRQRYEDNLDIKKYMKATSYKR